jgi:hypothetical protein
MAILATEWDRILQEPGFKALDWEKQQAVAQNYFDANLAKDDGYQALDALRKQIVQNNFFATIGPQPEDPVTDIGAFTNFVNSFYNSGLRTVSDYAALAGNFEWAEEFERENMLPSEGGLSGLAGSGIAGVIPAAVAIAAPMTAIPIFAHYAASGGGGARRYVHDYKKENPDHSVSAADEALVTIGAGAVIWASEKIALGGVIKPALKGVTPSLLRKLGGSIVGNKMGMAARQLVQLSLGEGVEEASEELMTNTLYRAMINPEQGILEDVSNAFLGGAIGGGVLFPLRHLKRYKRASDEMDAVFENARREVDQYVGKSAALKVIQEVEDRWRATGDPSVLDRLDTEMEFARQYHVLAGGNPEDNKGFVMETPRTALLPEGAAIPLLPEHALTLYERAGGTRTSVPVDIGASRESDAIVLTPGGDSAQWDTNEAIDVALDAANAAAARVEAAFAKGHKPDKTLATYDGAMATLHSQWVALNPGDVTGEGLQHYINQRVRGRLLRPRRYNVDLPSLEDASRFDAENFAKLRKTEASLLKPSQRRKRRKAIIGKAEIRKFTKDDLFRYNTYLRLLARRRERDAKRSIDAFFDEQGQRPPLVEPPGTQVGQGRPLVNPDEDPEEATRKARQESSGFIPGAEITNMGEVRTPPDTDPDEVVRNSDTLEEQRRERNADIIAADQAENENPLPRNVTQDPDDEDGLEALKAVAEELGVSVDELRMSDIDTRRTHEPDDLNDLTKDDDERIDGELLYQSALPRVEAPRGRAVAVNPNFQRRRRPDEPNIVQRHRLTHTLVATGLFKKVNWLPGQMWNTSNGNEVVASVNPGTGEVWFTSGIEAMTIGHEAFHRLAELMGVDHPLVQAGLQIAAGIPADQRRIKTQDNLETLSDIVGDYYAARKLEPNLLRRIANWLQDLWIGAKLRFGRTLTNEQVILALNARLSRKVSPDDELRLAKAERNEFYRQLWYQGHVSLDQTSRKSGTFQYQDKARPAVAPDVRPTRETIQRMIDVKMDDFEADREAEGRLTNEELRSRAVEIVLDPAKLARTEKSFRAGEGTISLEGLLALHIKAEFTYRQLYIALADTKKSEPNNQPLHELIEDKMHTEVTLKQRLETWRGRALELGNVPTNIVSLIEAVEGLERSLSPREAQQFAKIVDGGHIATPEVMADFMAGLRKPETRDYFWEVAMNGWLSNPVTHMVNAGNNALWATFQIPHRALMAGVDASLSSKIMQRIFPSLRGRERKVFLEETVGLWTGLQAGRKRAKREEVFKRVMRGENISELASKFNIDLGSARKAFARANPNTPLGAAMRKIAPAISFPTDALVASDVWFRTIAYDMQIHSLALREARRTGKPAESFIAHPTKKMMKDAELFAAMATFNNKPGRLVNAVIHWREKLPFGSGRLIIPFVNTINNIFQRAVEMTPGVGAAVHRHRVKAFDTDILAKQLEGAVMAFILMSMFDSEDITAAAPESPTERAAFYKSGKIPFAIRMPDDMPFVGGTWVSYSRIEPFNTVLSTIASGWKALEELDKQPEPDETVAGNLFAALANNISGNLVESTFTDGLGRLFKPSLGEGLLRTAERIPAGFTPYSGFWRALNRGVEAWEPDEDGNQGVKFRERNGWLGELAQVIPFGAFTKDYETYRGVQRVDAFGERIVIPGGTFRQWIPIRWSDPQLDTTEEELARLDIMPGLPSRDFNIRGETVQMPDDMFQKYAMAYGSTTKRALDRLIRSRNYQRLPEARQIQSIQRIVRRAHSQIRGRAVRELQALHRANARTQRARP